MMPPRKLSLLLERIDLVDELGRQLAHQRRTKMRAAFLRQIRSELARLRDELVAMQREAWNDTPPSSKRSPRRP